MPPLSVRLSFDGTHSGQAVMVRHLLDVCVQKKHKYKTYKDSQGGPFTFPFWGPETGDHF